MKYNLLMSKLETKVLYDRKGKMEYGKATDIDVPSSAAMKLKMAIAESVKIYHFMIEKLPPFATIFELSIPFLFPFSWQFAGHKISMLLTAQGRTKRWERQLFADFLLPLSA